MVFGTSLDRAQQVHLPRIQPTDKVLIIGGGTGRLLEHLLNQQPNQPVTYVEASSKMLEMTQARLSVRNTDSVVLLHGTHENVTAEAVYDVVITNFFLDLFTDASMQQVADRLNKALKIGGHWIFTDFISDRKQTWFQELLIRTMYIFFRVVTGLVTANLPDFEAYFRSANFQVLAHNRFCNGMVVSSLYRKIVQ